MDISSISNTALLPTSDRKKRIRNFHEYRKGEKDVWRGASPVPGELYKELRKTREEIEELKNASKNPSMLDLLNSTLTEVIRRIDVALKGALELLKEKRVTIVIDLRGLRTTKPEEIEDEKIAFREKNIVHNHLPLDSQNPPQKGEVIEFFSIFQKASPEDIIYIHCRGGRERTGILVALYRIKIEGISPEEALEDMKAHGYPLPKRKEPPLILQDFLLDKSKWEDTLSDTEFKGKLMPKRSWLPNLIKSNNWKLINLQNLQVYNKVYGYEETLKHLSKLPEDPSLSKLNWKSVLDEIGSIASSDPSSLTPVKLKDLAEYDEIVKNPFAPKNMMGGILEKLIKLRK